MRCNPIPGNWAAAVVAELCELALRQVSECNGRINDNYQARGNFRSWPRSAG